MKPTEQKYTQAEIDSNINILESRIDSLSLKRRELSQQINETKKQVVA